MLPLKIGLPTFLLIGSSVLLKLPSHVFEAWDHSVGNYNSLEKVVTFTIPQLNASTSSVATYVGSKTLPRESLLNGPLVNTSHAKRDEWYVAPLRSSH